MNLRTIAARTVVAGATTALAAGALVGVSTTAANAVDVTNTYVCSNSTLGLAFPSDMTVTGDLPVPMYGSGASVPAGIINISARATVPAEVAPLLAGAGVTGAKAKTWAASLGAAKVGIPLEGDFVTDETGTYWDADGSNLAFLTPAPGTYSAVLPQAFTLTAMQGDSESISLDCALAEGQVAQSFGSIDLVQQMSNISTPAKVVAKKGKAVKFTATFSNGTGGVGMGQVIAKEGSKTLDKATVKNGVAKLNLGKKLKVGKHKITVTYVGNPSIKTSSDKTTVIVKK